MLFEKLHKLEADVPKVLESISAVDTIYTHHQTMALPDWIELERLVQRAAIACAHYTKLSESLVTVTLTIVKLKIRQSQSFSVNSKVFNIGTSMADTVFDYFYAHQFPPYENPQSSLQWLLPALGHRDVMVSPVAAKRYCKSQGTCPR